MTARKLKREIRYLHRRQRQRNELAVTLFYLSMPDKNRMQHHFEKKKQNPQHRIVHLYVAHLKCNHGIHDHLIS